MVEAELPLGPSVSLLLASPTINLGAIVLLLIVFGWHVALFYGLVCLVAAVLVGWGIGRIPAKLALRDYLWIEEDDPVEGTRRVALRRAASLGGQLTRKFLPWLALATLAGVLIDAVVPASAVLHLGRWALVLGIPAAALLGSIMYADILLLIPMGYAFIQHGAPIPIVLTFMLAASGLSLPEVVVLTRVLHPRVVMLFVGAALVLYMLLGFGFLWL
jgi:uncharacterized membrane protein YraQ (UPF0718 family)